MPYPDLHIIGIDPGGTTGWARLTFPRRSIYGDADPKILEWDAGQFYGEETVQVDNIARYVREAQGLSYRIGPAVVGEGFSYETSVRGTDVLSPVRIMAMLVYAQHLGKMGDARVTYQDRGLAKSTATDQRLKAWGFWLPGEEHARDAMRHAITALRRARAKASIRGMLWNNP